METHFHHTEVGQFLAYANTILQAYIQLEVDGWWAYNQGGRPGIGGLGHPPPPPPYARIFTAQVRRGNSCQDCGGLEHPTTVCSWGE